MDDLFYILIFLIIKQKLLSIVRSVKFTCRAKHVALRFAVFGCLILTLSCDKICLLKTGHFLLFSFTFIVAEK